MLIGGLVTRNESVLSQITDQQETRRSWSHRILIFHRAKEAHPIRRNPIFNRFNRGDLIFNRANAAAVALPYWEPRVPKADPDPGARKLKTPLKE